MKRSQDALPKKLNEASKINAKRSGKPSNTKSADNEIEEIQQVAKVESLVALLRYRALKQPEGLAYSFLKDGINSAESLTYEALDRQAKILANAIEANGGVIAGDRVVLLYAPGVDFLVAFFGSLYAGLVPIPAPPPDAVRLKRTLPRLKSILDDGSAALILSTEEIHTYANEGEETLRSQGHLEEVVWLCSDVLIQQAGEAPPQEWLPPQINRHTIAYLQYTSGSTSSPKGVMLSHGNVLHHLKILQNAWRYTGTSVSVTWMPHFHDYGLVDGLLEALYVGIPCYILSPVTFVRRPVRWLEAISRYRGTHTQAPNFAYQLCVDKVTTKQLQALDLSSLSVASNGAEPIRAETLRQFIDTFSPCGFNATSLYPAYGMAETTLLISTKPHEALFTADVIDAQVLEQAHCAVLQKNGQPTRELVSCGPPITEVTVAIVNAETFARLQEGEVGEIWVCSDSVAVGYWHKREETERAFCAQITGETDAQHYLRTGDLGYLRNGELYVTGRLKDLIVIAGVNHYPQDIEWTVQQCSADLRTDHSAAFSIEVEGQERLVVIGEVTRSLDDWDELFKKIRMAVSQHHEIELFAFVALKKGGILKTSSGKLQRQGCRQAFLEDRLVALAKWQKPQQTKVTHPRKVTTRSESVVSDWLTHTLADLLQIPVEIIEPAEPFAAYGLTSFIGIQLVQALEQWLGVDELSPTLLWDYPSIVRLSGYLSIAHGTQAVMSDSAANSNVLFETTNTNINTNKRHHHRTHESDLNPNGLNEGPTTSPLQPGHHANQAEEDAIAIIGMACRLPGATSPEAFWELLINKTQAVSEVPTGRWTGAGVALDVGTDAGQLSTLQGGFLKDVEGFDAELFGISGREAKIMDPQQRLLLELGWESLERAGYAPDSLGESQTGVFIGISTDDYATWQMQDSDTISAYTGPGKALSIAANRLSYYFNFIGPSMAIDTACSSSLVSIHQACHALRQEECTMALAGGVNLLLAPQMSIALSQAGMLAADGRCKTFDAQANGYVRGEGGGLLVLKRWADAKRDGDNVLACIRGSAVNQDGRSNGLTAPNGLAQQRVVGAALASAGVKGRDVSYVETHGTGTALGDPIEVNSLAQVLVKDRNPDQPCALGAVKANIGHLEAAAGVAGVIKTVLSLQQNQIPPQPSLQQLNPYLKIEGTPLHVPTEVRAWPKGRRVAGVSSFGFGGTNAHLILEGVNAEEQVTQNKNPPQTQPRSEAGGSDYDVCVQENRCNVLVLRAKNKIALKQLVERWQYHLKKSVTNKNINAWCSAANRTRATLPCSVVVWGESPSQLHEGLSHFLAAREGAWVESSEVNKASSVAFLFTGQGSQYLGMGRQLYQSQTLFRDVMDECDQHLFPTLQQSIVSLLYDDATPAKEALLARTDITQPVLFAFEYALARLWMSWGLKPSVLLGHSLGEYVAACIAGVFTLQDGLRLVAARAALMHRAPGEGGMLGVVAKEPLIREVLASIDSSVDIAVYNSPQHFVLAGPRAELAQLAQQFEQRAIEIRPIKVSHGFHSSLMDPVLEEFAAVANRVTYHPPLLPVLSNLDGQLVKEEIACADYWVRHVRNPVRFSDGLMQLQTLGIQTFVEIGPAASLLSLARQHFDEDAFYFTSLRAKVDDKQQMLSSAAALCAQGHALDLHPTIPAAQVKRLSKGLPVYPFSHKPYRLPAIKPVSEKASAKFPGRLASSPLLAQYLFENDYTVTRPAWLAEHRVFDHIVVPGAGHLSLVFEALSNLVARGDFDGRSSFALEEVLFPQPLIIPAPDGRTVHLAIDKQTEAAEQVFRLISMSPNYPEGLANQVDEHAVGKIVAVEGSDISVDVKALRAQCAPVEENFYTQIWQPAIALGSSFRWVKKLWRAETQVLAQLQKPDSFGGGNASAGYYAPPGLLDSCLQILTAAVPLGEGDALVPFGFDHFSCFAPLTAQNYWSHLQIRVEDENNPVISEEVVSDVRLLSAQGQVVAEVKGFRARQVKSTRFLQERGLQDAVYSQQWQKISLEPTIPAGRWLLVGTLAAREWLAAGLLAIGVDVLHVDSAITKESDWRQDLVDLLPLAGVLFLGDEAPGMAANEVQSASNLCDALVAWVQLIVSLPESTKLVVLTQDAHGRKLEQALAPQQSALWGLARVVRLEYPELNCQCIDLDRSTYPDYGVAVHKVVQAIALTEPDVLLSGEDALVPRLQQQAVTVPKTAAFNSDASYVVSGGLGALGLRLAEWLIEQGAQHLLLLGRNAPSAEKQRRIETMQRSGAQIVVDSIDVSNQDALASSIRNYGDKAPPVSGVFHLAGQLADNVLSTLNRSAFETALRPKLGGALALHEVFAAQPLDYFVCFSSAAALTGSLGQGAYAAANAATDSLMAWRRLQGLAGQSVQWGPWAEAGMAAEQQEKDQQRFLGYGIEPIDPKNGMAFLNWVLEQRTEPAVPATLVAMSVDWSRYLSHLYGDAVPPMYREIVSRDANPQRSENAESKVDLIASLTDLPADQRHSRIEQLLRNAIASIIGLEDRSAIKKRKPLFDLGLDSLGAIELRNRLAKIVGRPMRATLLFDFPSLEALTTHLEYEVLGFTNADQEDTASAAEAAEEQLNAATLEKIEQLSDEELANLLAEELGDKS